MRLRHTLVKVFVWGGLGAVVVASSGAEGGQEVRRDARPTLEEAFRGWDKGFSSDRKDDRVDALRSMLPRKEEIALLFPEQVDLLWPILDEGHTAMLENVDQMAAQMTRGGGITAIKPIDVRADARRAEGPYREVLAMIPQDVEVFELVVTRGRSTSGSSAYLYVNNRWCWVRGFEAIPKLLESLR
ncbi:hypothetical protein [Tautonia rosea]|uniref:hypothetical protein n=1 Tax=Tautonia rosea TaxID=2728037 RepID=UPI001474E07C|nr:hypothetical protein [Tautonia rosea]